MTSDDIEQERNNDKLKNSCEALEALSGTTMRLCQEQESAVKTGIA